VGPCTYCSPRHRMPRNMGCPVTQDTRFNMRRMTRRANSASSYSWAAASPWGPCCCWDPTVGLARYCPPHHRHFDKHLKPSSLETGGRHPMTWRARSARSYPTARRTTRRRCCATSWRRGAPAGTRGCGCRPRRVPGRGLHSSTFQLNLSRFRHNIHPRHPPMPPKNSPIPP